MMRKLFTLLLALSLVLPMAVPAFATETTAPAVETEVSTENRCGEDMTWEFADGTLTITGSGAMDDFTDAAPWAAHKDQIKRVVLSGSITYIGARAFSDYDALETVNFGSALVEIGAEGFKSCGALTVIYLPSSFKVFGESSFMSCRSLTAIHCSGRFPSFRMNCMWDTYGTIYYPADKPWSVEHIAQMEAQFKGRIEFLASDGTDHYNPEEETVPVTETPTEASTEEPTKAPTEAPTEAPTAAPTQAPVPPQTVPETEQVPIIATSPVTETEPPLQPDSGSRSWIGIVIIGAAALFILTGMIAVKASSRKGKYTKRRKKR